MWSVATAHRPPYMFVDRETGSFTGLLVDLLPLLFMAAGLNTTASSFSYYTAPINSGGSLVNGTWTGARSPWQDARSSSALVLTGCAPWRISRAPFHAKLVVKDFCPCLTAVCFC